MIREEWFVCADGARLFLRHWENEGGARPDAVLHVVHGMSEHGMRYRCLAERALAAGVELWIADQRGHGRTADLSVNGPGNGGLRGHCADTDGAARLLADAGLLSDYIRKVRPGVPFFLMGHSWGSFVVQAYMEAGPGRVDGCLLSGTRGSGGVKVPVGAALFGLCAALRGERTMAAAVRAVMSGPYSRPFDPVRPPFDWMTRDAAELDAFMADPFVTTAYSWGFCRDMLRTLARIHRRDAIARMPADVPVYVFSGGMDPVGGMGRSPASLVRAYRAAGLDVTFTLYPGARHETLHETNRDEVMKNLLDWILKHVNV